MASTRRVINILALTLLGLVLIVVGIVCIIIFWPSDFTWLGIGGVNERHVWTRYESDEIAAALEHRNLIIHSRHTDVEVRVRKHGQHDTQGVMHERGSITIFENARGLSFNNIHRTQIVLTQVLMDGGEVYHKIRIVAPTGIVTRNARVILNLVDADEQNHPPYNFILDTGIGRVDFRADQVVENMNIDNITVLPGSVGPITMPAVPTAAFPFRVSLNRLTVQSNIANVHVPQNVREEVKITSPSGSVTVGSVGVEGFLDAIVDVPGSTSINVTIGSVFGDVLFNSTLGSLRITGQAHGVLGGIVMQTSTASLTATRIGAQLDFVSRVSSTVSIGTTMGVVDATFYGAGSMAITHSFSIVEIQSRAAGLTVGGTGATQGARGPVTINNRYGATRVNFARDAFLSSALTFTGFDGNINATRIIGLTNITIQIGGRAQVFASFAEVNGTNNITFVGSAQPGTTFGNVTVTLLTRPIAQGGPFDGFILRVHGTARARDHTNWENILGGGNAQIGVEIHNYSNGGDWPVRNGGPGILNVTTSNSFWLRAAAG